MRTWGGVRGCGRYNYCYLFLGYNRRRHETYQRRYVSVHHMCCTVSIICIYIAGWCGGGGSCDNAP